MDLREEEIGRWGEGVKEGVRAHCSETVTTVQSDPATFHHTAWGVRRSNSSVSVAPTVRSAQLSVRSGVSRSVR